MVALVVLAVLTGMAFRGIEAILRAKDHAFAATDRTLRVGTGISQFEYDVSQITDTQVVDPLSFDGATLRLTRRTPDGLQLVLWTLQDHRWQRWASAPMTHVGQVQDAWLRSQQWESIAADAVTVLDQVDSFQVHTYCLSGGWGNVQSTCGNTITSVTDSTTGGSTGINSSSTTSTTTPATGSTSSTSTSTSSSTSTGTGAGTSTSTSTSTSASGSSSTNGSTNTNTTRLVASGVFPIGIQILLQLPEGLLTRERELPNP